MIFISILLSIAAIGFLCWLLFTLAVFALPFFAGVTVGMWAYGTGAGWLGAILVGFVAAGLTFGLGQILLVTVRTTWEIGRASCRERVCQYVEISVVAVSLKKK